MTTADWLWLALAVGPIPVALVWRAYAHRRAIRRGVELRSMMDRRERFGGFISLPGDDKAHPLDRPDR